MKCPMCSHDIVMSTSPGGPAHEPGNDRVFLDCPINRDHLSIMFVDSRPIHYDMSFYLNDQSYMLCAYNVPYYDCEYTNIFKTAPGNIKTVVTRIEHFVYLDLSDDTIKPDKLIYRLLNLKAFL